MVNSNIELTQLGLQSIAGKFNELIDVLIELDRSTIREKYLTNSDMAYKLRLVRSCKELFSGVVLNEKSNLNEIIPRSINTFITFSRRFEGSLSGIPIYGPKIFELTMDIGHEFMKLESLRNEINDGKS